MVEGIQDGLALSTMMIYHVTAACLLAAWAVPLALVLGWGKS
jgi:hypothetical protein